MSKYKFTRADFGPLDTVPLHLDLLFDVKETAVVVHARTTFVHRGDIPLSVLKLNSSDLDVLSVCSVAASVPLGSSKAFVAHVASFSEGEPLGFEVDKANQLLKVMFPVPVSCGQEFTIKTVSVATPTENILEGIYYDYTPVGKPRTLITQCQQYGFQRIVPSIDTMTAKTFYTTTIVADAGYTSIITNGDLAPEFVDEFGRVKRCSAAEAGIPDSVIPSSDPRVVLRYYNHKVNMAPYLFFLGCGTYDTYTRTLEYPDGDCISLELLVFPGLVQPDHAVVAVNALHDSVMWTLLSTGPEATEHGAERKRVYELISERERLKSQLWGAQVRSNTIPTPVSAAPPGDHPALSQLRILRGELKSLMAAWTVTGYKYTGAVYREIAMENSDYGGMENVGNTTILSSRIAPSDYLLDGAYIYMEGVKIHEYYHNINGSQVTGQSPFEIWLNEAVTVHIQRQREDELFGADFMRLRTVLYAFKPATGPLAEDASPIAMPVEPYGFNRTQELISSMTYSKAPEFVRMVELMIGKPAFNRGLHEYHSKYAFGNATTWDWVACMEAASGIPLKDMATGWLKRSGHPHVKYSSTYDDAAKVYRVRISQTPVRGVPESEEEGSVPGPWVIPIEWALVRDGADMKAGVYIMREDAAEFDIPDVDSAPDFLSLARGWSMFGSVSCDDADADLLTRQALSDPDVINRYFAFRAVANSEKVRIVQQLVSGDSAVTVSSEYVSLFSRLLFDDAVTPSTRGLILSEAEALSGSHPSLAYRYWEQAAAKKFMYEAVFRTHRGAVLALFSRLCDANKPGPHLEQIHERALKHLLASVIVAAVFRPPAGVTPVGGLPMDDIKRQLRSLLTSTFMSDAAVGFASCLEAESDPDERKKLIASVETSWRKHPTTTETFISVLSGVDSDDTAGIIRAMVDSSSPDSLFNINLAGHARSVASSWGAMRKRSLLTDDGLELTKYLILRIGRVNQMSASALLAAFGDIDLFPADGEGVLCRERLIAALRDVRSQLDPVAQQSLYNNISTLLHA